MRESVTIEAKRDHHHPRRCGCEILCGGLQGWSWNRTTDSENRLAVVLARGAFGNPVAQA